MVTSQGRRVYPNERVATFAWRRRVVELRYRMQRPILGADQPPYLSLFTFGPHRGRRVSSRAIPGNGFRRRHPGELERGMQRRSG